MSSVFKSWQWQQTTIRSSQLAIVRDLVMIEKMFKEMDAEIGIKKMGEDKAHIRIKASAREKNGIGLTLKRGEREILS